MSNVSFLPFQPSDRSNFRRMLRAEKILWRLNRTPLWNVPLRNWLIRRLFGSIDGDAYCIQVPFHACYGENIHVGRNFFANYSCTIMDHAEVHIGDNVMLAPNVQILTASHPMLAEERAVRQVDGSFEPRGLGNWELVAPVTIGNDVWVAAGSIICAGVTVGDGSVIGAGSVVTRDVPAGVFAVGNPCRVVREISKSDRSLFECLPIDT